MLGKSFYIKRKSTCPANGIDETNYNTWNIIRPLKTILWKMNSFMTWVMTQSKGIKQVTKGSKSAYTATLLQTFNGVCEYTRGYTEGVKGVQPRRQVGLSRVCDLGW